MAEGCPMHQAGGTRTTTGAECICPPQTEKTHWGGEDSRPTSLHGNGAKAFGRTTLDWAEVDCGLCRSLRPIDAAPNAQPVVLTPAERDAMREAAEVDARDPHGNDGVTMVKAVERIVWDRLYVRSSPGQATPDA